MSAASARFAAGIIAAGAAAFKCLEGLSDDIKKMDKSQKLVREAATKILPISLALVALGVGIIFVVMFLYLRKF